MIPERSLTTKPPTPKTYSTKISKRGEKYVLRTVSTTALDDGVPVSAIYTDRYDDLHMALLSEAHLRVQYAKSGFELVKP